MTRTITTLAVLLIAGGAVAGDKSAAPSHVYNGATVTLTCVLETCDIPKGLQVKSFTQDSIVASFPQQALNYDADICQGPKGILIKCDDLPKYYPGVIDLDHAKAICNKHEIPSNTVLTTFQVKSTPGGFPPEWHACYEIRKKWESSEAAEAERQRAAQEKADLDFVNRVAGEKGK